MNSQLFFPVETNDINNQDHSTLSTMDRAVAIGNVGKQGDRIYTIDSAIIPSSSKSSCPPVGANKTRDYAHGPLATRSRLSRRNAASMAIITILGYVVVGHGGRRRQASASPNPE
jgi:hypothetical protein